MMRRVTGCNPYLFGPTIIGFGSYHYEYESGHKGDACITGFASRNPDLLQARNPAPLACPPIVRKPVSLASPSAMGMISAPTWGKRA